MMHYLAAQQREFKHFYLVCQILLLMTTIFYKTKPTFIEASGMEKEPLLLLFKMLKK